MFFSPVTRLTVKMCKLELSEVSNGIYHAGCAIYIHCMCVTVCRPSGGRPEAEIRDLRSTEPPFVVGPCLEFPIRCLVHLCVLLCVVYIILISVIVNYLQHVLSVKDSIWACLR